MAGEKHLTPWATLGDIQADTELDWRTKSELMAAHERGQKLFTWWESTLLERVRQYMKDPERHSEPLRQQLEQYQQHFADGAVRLK